MNYYEKVMILDANIDDNAVNETIERVKNVIVSKGGEIFKTDNWGRRKLAYELNKHQKGNYVLLFFKSPPETILELEKLGKVVDSIIKFMVVRLTKKKQIDAMLKTVAEASEKEDKTTAAPAQTETAVTQDSEKSPEENNVQ
ncbi:MAG: 30S ribosomal protein S6 [Nitrospiraceae bacterium]|nr:MAG: 30S ribosomal protein S6 [Nitrospiraceae bacterium]